MGYEHNQSVIADNTNMRGGMIRGALRILRPQAACGVQRQRWQYSRFHCKGAAINHGSPHKCISFGSLRVDQAVAGELLAALRPIGVQAALHATEQRSNDDQGKRRQLELALDQARFDAARSRPSRSARAPWVIKASELQRPEVRAAVQAPRKGPPIEDPNQISRELQ